VDADVGLFVVEHHMLGMEPDDLDAAGRAAVDACARLASPHAPIHCLRGIYLPGDGRFLLLLEAPSEEAVRRMSAVAQLPVRRVLRAVELRL
jgi:uncharacterized protein DUF4242